MRKIVHALSAGALAVATTAGLSLTAAAPAQAAAAGASCKLSANWTVKFSANYTNISQFGVTTHYIVMSSPGPIDMWTTMIMEAGNAGPLWGPKIDFDPISPKRFNPVVTGDNVYIDMEVWGGNGSCKARLNLD